MYLRTITTVYLLVSTPVFAVDTDSDGLSDALEVAVGLNPNDASDFAIDTDGDGVFDGDEVLDGTDHHSADDVMNPLNSRFGAEGALQFITHYDGSYSANEPDEVMVSTNGDIYVSGYAEGETIDSETGDDIEHEGEYIARITEAGSIDTSFADDGYFHPQDIGITGVALIHDMDFTSDGLLVSSTGCDISGYVNSDCLYLLSDSGNLNTNVFTQVGLDGIESFSSGRKSISLVASDGSIYNASTTNEADTKVETRKINGDGTLNTSFAVNTNNVLTVDGYEGYATESTLSLYELSDGSLIGVVESLDGMPYLFKFNPQGELDASYSGNGIVERSNFSNPIRASALLADDRIAIAMGGDGIHIVLIKTDGTIDADFGKEGIFTLENTVHIHSLMNVFFSDDGGFVIAASYKNSASSTEGLSLIKVSSDGVLDTRFSGDGISRYALDEGDSIYSADMLNSGDIVVAGTRKNAISGEDENLLIVMAIEPGEDSLDNETPEEESGDITEDDSTEEGASSGSVSLMFLLLMILAVVFRFSRVES